LDSGAIDQSPPKRRRPVTRGRILASAEQLFLEQGFRGTSVNQIAAAAGYTSGAVYSSFGSKDELFLAVTAVRYDRIVDRLRRLSAELAAGADDVALAFAEAYIRSMHEPRWVAVYFEFIMAAIRDPALRPRVVADHRAAFTAIREVLEGILPSATPALDQIALSISFLLEGVVIFTLIDDALVPEGTAAIAGTLRALLAAEVQDA
jgi:AcrR family transcriptional regulator